MNEEEKKLIIYMFPMLFIVIFLPFLIFIKQIELKGILYYAWTGEEVNYNLFTYYRSIVLLVVAIGAIIMLCQRRI